MGRPQNADGRQTRQAIVDAALQLFAQKGYFGTSLRDIATAVGVRESALYNYFPSKELLFDDLIQSHHQAKMGQLAELIDQPITDVHASMMQLAMLVLETFAIPRQQQLFRILMSDGIRLARDGRINLLERMHSGQARLHGLMRRLMREGWLRAADPQFLAMEFMGPLFLWRHLQAIGSTLPAITRPEVFARRHVDQFLRGAAADSRDRVAGTPDPRRVRAPLTSARRRGSPRRALEVRHER
jgi:AcrR family transcriptional regulator